jgi:hypothetical protein
MMIIDHNPVGINSPEALLTSHHPARSRYMRADRGGTRTFALAME